MGRVGGEGSRVAHTNCAGGRGDGRPKARNGGTYTLYTGRCPRWWLQTQTMRAMVGALRSGSVRGSTLAQDSQAGDATGGWRVRHVAPLPPDLKDRRRKRKRGPDDAGSGVVKITVEYKAPRAVRDHTTEDPLTS